MMKMRCRGLCLGGFLRLFVVALLFLVVCNLVVNSTFCVAVRADEASTVVADADGALKEAFKKVLVAEEAGANVSDLLFKLDEAGELLSRAERALGSGNLSEAVVEAGASVVIVYGVENDALALKVSAEADGQRVLLQTAVFSVVGIVVFVVVLFVVWTRFRRVRTRRLVMLKPEVSSVAVD